MHHDRMRILAVDDEPKYTWAMRSILESVGYEVAVANDGVSALAAVADYEPDLILLDVRMPHLSGLDVCKRIREFSTVPVIFLTALAEEADQVRGLDAGGDDYVTKPFGAQELLARVRATLRRVRYSSLASEDGTVRTGALEINLLGQKVTLAGQEIILTATEFQVLLRLAERPNHVCRADDLLEEIWGATATQDGHLLRQVIYRLRQKLETNPSHPVYIVNHPGVGYVLSQIE